MWPILAAGPVATLNDLVLTRERNSDGLLEDGRGWSRCGETLLCPPQGRFVDDKEISE